MLSLVLTMLVLQAAGAADRPVALLVASKRPGTESWTGAVAQRVHSALEREGVPGLVALEETERRLKTAGLSDTRACQAVRSCVARSALILGPNAVVVSVDVARAGSSLAVLLEGVAADGGRVLASTELVLPIGKWDDQLVLPVVLFARELKTKLAAEAEAARSAADAPLVAQLEPVAPPPTPSIATPGPAAKPARVLPWVLLGGAVAGAGVGVALAVSGAGDQQALQASITPNAQGERTSHFTRSELTALENGGNAKLTAALISGVVAAALGVGTAIAFAAGD